MAGNKEAADIIKKSGRLCCLTIEPASNGFTMEVRRKSKSNGKESSPYTEPERRVYDEDDREKMLDEIADLLDMHAGSSSDKDEDEYEPEPAEKG